MRKKIRQENLPLTEADEEQGLENMTQEEINQQSHKGGGCDCMDTVFRREASSQWFLHL